VVDVSDDRIQHCGERRRLVAGQWSLSAALTFKMANVGLKSLCPNVGGRWPKPAGNADRQADFGEKSVMLSASP
jgi:hypothetical protein